MRVATWYRNRDVRLQETPVPAIGSGEILMRVIASGICGSDVMEWYRLHKAPLVLGHEVAGEVAAVGPGVNSFAAGDRIAATHHVPCYTCRYCLGGHETACETLLSKTNFHPGGFAEYLRLPPVNVERGTFKLPPDVSFEEGTFMEPLACVLRGQRQARLRTGGAVVVLGSGISGLLHISLARALGAGHIIATDVADSRLEAARRFGADEAIAAAQYGPDVLRHVNDGRLADVVIVCAGAVPAVHQALASVDRGGTVLFFAPTRPEETVPLSIMTTFWRTGITLTTSYAGSPADCFQALELIRARRIPVAEMITHRLGLAETGRGFQLVAEAGESIKVIIEPQR